MHTLDMVGGKKK